MEGNDSLMGGCHMVDEQYGRGCMCGYRENDSNEPFVPICFDMLVPYQSVGEKDPDAYMCPACHMLQAK